MRQALIGFFVLVLAGCATAGTSPTPGSAKPSASASASVAPSASVSVIASLPEAIPHEVAASPNAELREELLAMMALDQSVRTGIALEDDDRTAEDLFAAMGTVDDEHSDRMREILDEFGWPGWSLVGHDGSEAAYLASTPDANPFAADFEHIRRATRSSQDLLVVERTSVLPRVDVTPIDLVSNGPRRDRAVRLPEHLLDRLTE